MVRNYRIDNVRHSCGLDLHQLQKLRSQWRDSPRMKKTNRVSKIEISGSLSGGGKVKRTLGQRRVLITSCQTEKFHRVQIRYVSKERRYVPRKVLVQRGKPQ